ncbi:MAG: hypothetical protein MZV64_13005 [Ignavibacteriales bacterium]|nr:hypothetical protein [Ignavibacteriales bacterium]
MLADRPPEDRLRCVPGQLGGDEDRPLGESGNDVPGDLQGDRPAPPVRHLGLETLFGGDAEDSDAQAESPVRRAETGRRADGQDRSEGHGDAFHVDSFRAISVCVTSPNTASGREYSPDPP